MRFIRSARIRPFVWFLTVLFTIFSIPHFEQVTFELAGFLNSAAHAEEISESQAISEADSSSESSGATSKSNASAANSTLQTVGEPEPPPPQNTAAPAVIPETMQFTGAATYKVQIDLPQGRAGVSPNLAVTYNSYQGNGFLGVGWNIDMGAIQRSTKRGVSYSSNNFVSSINGSQGELVAKPAWGSNYYGDKIDETYLKYYYNSSTGGWEATSKIGLKYYYGTNSDSRQDSALGVFKWCLDRVEDPNGNYMIISYFKDQGAIYLDKIRYTANSITSIGPGYEVRFLWEARNDSYPVYTTNFSVVTAFRLSEVQVYGSNNNLIKKYVLQYVPEYSSVTFRSLLNSITQYGPDGNSLPPTTFEYQNNGVGVSSTASGYGKYIGDFNGDGKFDLLSPNYTPFLGAPSIGVMKGPEFSSGFPFQIEIWHQYSWPENPTSTMTVADFNGDGKHDVMSEGMPPFIYTSSGSSFIVNQNWARPSNSPTGWYNSNARIGDFNGDGKTDYVNYICTYSPCEEAGCQRYGIEVYTVNSAGNNWNTSAIWAESGIPMNPTVAADFNGDGKTDLLENTSSEWGPSMICYYSTGSGFQSVSVVPPVRIMSYSPMLSADFNGDGKSDILILQGGTAYVGISQGASFTFSVWGSSSYFGSSATYVADLNGDGKTDLLQVDTNSGIAYVWFSNGNSFNSPVYWGSGFGYSSAVQVGDLNGDGMQDLMQTDSYGWNAGIWFTKPPSDLLKTITNPMGGISSIEYRSSSEYQNALMPFVLQTVKSISTDDGRGNVSTTNYTYEGGLYDIPERDFRGFRKVTASNSEQTVQTLFHQDAVKKGKVEQVITNTYDGHYSQADNVYEIRQLDGGASFPALISTTTTVTDAGATPFTITKTFDYDTYLNLKSTTTSGTQSDTVISETEFTSFTDKWIVARPIKSTVKNAAGEVKNRKWMDYDSTTGNLISEEVCKSDDPQAGCLSRNSAQNPVSTYSYHPEGNLSQVTDPLGNITTYTYDSATKTHVYDKINALGHKTTTIYDNGRLITMIPPHLQGTSYMFTYAYDGLGRKDTEYRPDGGWTKYTYYLDTPTTQYTQVQEHIAGGSQTYSDLVSQSYFDGLGRTYLTRSPGPDNKTIVMQTVYDSFGRVVKKSNPYYEGGSAYYSAMTFDGLSRLISATAPDNTTASTSHQGLTKIGTDQNGHQTTSSFDIYQRLRSVTDAKGTITEYDYDTLGNLIKVTAAKGIPEQNITTITYDSLGQKRSMTDPDMGCWTYAYDKLGNLSTQVDAKGQQIAFSYDTIGRIAQKASGTIILGSYSYDDAAVAYSKGKLTKVTANNGYDYIKRLDIMQRPLRTEKKVDTLIRTINKTYDSAGRVASVNYTMGTSRTYNYYYNAGALAALKDPSGNTVVSYGNFTAMGQPQLTEMPKTNGSSVKTLKNFTPETGRLIELVTKKIVGTSETKYQHLTYEFDAKGNIITINDVKNNEVQNYQYDELDRLIQASADGSRSYAQQYSYDAIGNILSKSDVGAYSYDYAGKPHAVLTAGGITLQYDANGNMISRDKAGGPNTTVTYTVDNKPSRIIKTGTGAATALFTYDGNGVRVKKQNQTTGVISYYFGEAYEKRGSIDMFHLAGNGRVATIRSDGSILFYHSDHLGSTSVVTDANGDLRQDIGYYPFGTYRYNNSRTYPKANYTFTGQEDDDDIGLYNYNARLYDPELGRFISADTIVPEPGNLQSLNRYSYCVNNPLKYVDPTGHWVWEVAAIAAFIGAMIGAATAAANGGNIFVGALTGAFAGALSYIGGPVGAAVGNALSGVVNAQVNGGDPALGGVMGWMGGVAGACTGATIGQAGITNSYGVNAGVTVAAGGVVGGTLTAMAGGNFWEGFAYGAAGSAAALALGAAYGNGENENAQQKSNNDQKMSASLKVSELSPFEHARAIMNEVNGANSTPYMVADLKINWGQLGTGCWQTLDGITLMGLGVSATYIATTFNPYLGLYVGAHMIPAFGVGAFEFYHGLGTINDAIEYIPNTKF